MKHGHIVVGVSVASAVLAAGIFAPAYASVTGEAGSTITCLNDATKAAEFYVTFVAQTVEELESDKALITKIRGSNPCSSTTSGSIGIRDRRTGEVFDAAINLTPGASFQVSRRQLETEYKLNKRFRSTGSVGGSSGAAVAGPGVVIIATL